MLEMDVATTMSDTERPPTRRAELFVRAALPSPAKQCRTTIECQLQDLQHAGVVDEWTTTVWKKRVPEHGECPEHARYEEFQSWAQEVGVSLGPGFDTRECYCWTTGQKRTELVLPVRCLAIYEDETLSRVAPVNRGGRIKSIEECLDELKAKETASTDTTRTITAD
jgi:hypothetical protein